MRSPGYVSGEAVQALFDVLVHAVPTMDDARLIDLLVRVLDVVAREAEGAAREERAGMLNSLRLVPEHRRN